MIELFGHTRARIAGRHALITPHNHVNSVLPGVTGAASVVLINQAMGAGFAQTSLTFQEGGAATLPAGELETFGYVMSGGASVAAGDLGGRLAAGGYFFAPPGSGWSLREPEEGTRLMLFEKRYVPLAGALPPGAVISRADAVEGAPFLGDPAADLKVLLPDQPSYDMAVNLFSYQPGGHLPFVEVHVMEHGLVMLEGTGVYRLEDSWYPVQAGDVIWMAPYCAQWFVAMGKTPAKYLYYKDVNRAAI